MNDLVILLTACINPGGMQKTELQDSNIRLQQYIDAVNYYLKNTIYKIVLCENSNYDLSDIFTDEIKKGRLEIITFNGNDYDKHLGKGYGEALIIKKAIECSHFISEKTAIIKITGRLIVKNINSLIRQYNFKNSVYCNLVRAQSRKHTCYSIFFIAPATFFTTVFLQKIELINDDAKIYFEHILMDACEEWRKRGYTWNEFYLPVIISGQSGTTGDIYKFSYLMYLKQFIRYITHKLGIYKF